MKRLKIMVLAMAFLLCASIGSVFAEDKVTGSASLGAFNRYIFRGYELSSKSIVVQPAVSVSYKGFSAGFWSNVDTDVHATQSVTDTDYLNANKGHKSYNETDFTLSYTYNIDKFSLAGGYIYYATKYAKETEEVFASASLDIITKPTISVYRDINEYAGTYVNLSLSHSIPVYKEITFDMGVSAGYFAGNGSYWKTHEKSTGAYTGKKYNALHDGMIKAGFTIPVAKNLSFQPVAQYWFPLSSDAKKTVDGNSFNPNGKLDRTFVAGANLVLSF
ncbi:MAG: hypothetical protein C0415_05460 [Thermodesulfovibrio sp.]|nr:hypothetical protein [Thermodesulfovibrio sp.]